MKKVKGRFAVAFAIAIVSAIAIPQLAFAMEDNQATNASMPPDSQLLVEPDLDDQTPTESQGLANVQDGGIDAVIEEPALIGDDEAVLGNDSEKDAEETAVDDAAESDAVGERVNDAPSTTEPEAFDSQVTEKVPVVSTSASTSTKTEKITAATAPNASITYRGHVQNIGWQGWVKNGALSGTSGKGLRMEAFQVKLILPKGVSGGVQCKAHVQNIGWQNVVNSGGTVGTTGLSYRIEALKIKLTGEVSQWFDVFYRAHVQNIGWQGWVKNGALSGTSGKGLRMEALQIKLVQKEKKSSTPSDGIVGVNYSSKVQDYGWKPVVEDGSTSGTTGQGLGVHSLKIKLDKGIYTGGVSYRTRDLKSGWMDWKSNGVISNSGSSNLGAFQVKLTGTIASKYDIMYRAHVQNIGWQPWVLNGGTAGTSTQKSRIEAYQVKLVKKGTTRAIPEGTYFISSAGKASIAVDLPGSSSKTGTQMKTASFADDVDHRFYVRKEASGLYSIQSVSSGLFLADSNGRVVQGKDIEASNRRWKAVWDSGYSFINASTGKVISINGDTVASGKVIETKNNESKANQHWVLTKTQLIMDGTYILSNVASGNVLDVANISWKDGANIMVAKANGGGNQAFRLNHKGSNAYSIRSALTYKAVAPNQGNVRQYTYSGAKNQLWFAELTRNGKIVFVNKESGKVLNAGGTVSGSNVNNVTSNVSSERQMWNLKPSNYSLTGNAVLDQKIAKVLYTHTTLRSAYDYVSSFRYRSGSLHTGSSRYLSDSVTSSYALEMINRGSGNCYRFASLFSWLARGLGYSSKVCSGWVPRIGGGKAPHGWTEIYQGGKTYCCDPDMYEAIPSVNWYMFTYSNPPMNYGFW